MDADERQFETDSSDELRNEALLFLEKGNTCHREGDLEEAIRNYLESIRRFPTADAHTYLGWMYSFQGNVEEAIDQCHIAISLDPDFGNPYNDLGVYLMESDQTEAAIPWLMKAKQASRYEPRHFPYLNLGRIYLQRKEYDKALLEYRSALKLAPQDSQAIRVVRELTTLLN